MLEKPPIVGKVSRSHSVIAVVRQRRSFVSLGSFRIGVDTLTTENRKFESARDASSVRGHKLLPFLIHFLHHRPPTWLALAIGAGTGAAIGLGIGVAFGGWWLPSITLLGLVLGSITGLDLLLPRPDWAPSLEGPETERYAGPFQSVAGLLLCALIAVAAGLFFANALASVRFLRLPTGQVECWSNTQFLFGYVQRSSHTVGVHDVTLDAHGGIMFHADDGRMEFLGSVSGDRLPAIESFLDSQDAALELGGPAWITFLSPGFFLLAGILFWLTTRTLRAAIVRLTKVLRSSA